MHIAQTKTLQCAPNIGALFGSTGRQDVINKLNNEWNGGNSGVLFGGANDPYATGYNEFMSVIYNEVQDTTKVINNTGDIIYNRDRIYEILCEKDLWDINPTMQYHLIMHKPLRTLLEEDKIYGWDYDIKDLPDEDVVGNQIKNGCWDSTMDTDTIEWYWDSSEKEYSEEDLSMIEKSRLYIEDFLWRQMQSNKKDPTNLSGRIG